MQKANLLQSLCRGAIGKDYVVRRYGKFRIITKYPDMTGIVASDKQRDCRNLFKEANAYAKSIFSDPEQKAILIKKAGYARKAYTRLVKQYMADAKNAGIMVNQVLGSPIQVSIPSEEKSIVINNDGIQQPVEQHDLVEQTNFEPAGCDKSNQPKNPSISQAILSSIYGPLFPLQDQYCSSQFTPVLATNALSSETAWISLKTPGQSEVSFGVPPYHPPTTSLPTPYHPTFWMNILPLPKDSFHSPPEVFSSA